ncbi:iron-sulfur cluster biosynthesis family protein [Priestia koreensis]|uniref:iron-sulfur cluster biosynthesis family protein n=1 Tax=Priestia koreensis TaxID=284581 RepID=UPI003458A6B0
MNITFTDTAIERIKKTWPDQDKGVLKLKYDTDGCGCVVSGVSALWLIPEAEEGDTALQTNFVPVYVEKTTLVFFDENVTVDFSTSANTYMLKSPNQILNPRMSLLNQLAVSS